MADKKTDLLAGFPASLRSALLGFEEKAPRRLLAAYPHIVERIDQLWSRPNELNDYWSELIISDRSDRQGFPADALVEIFFLKQLRELTLSAREGGPWERSGERLEPSKPERAMMPYQSEEGSEDGAGAELSELSLFDLAPAAEPEKSEASSAKEGLIDTIEGVREALDNRALGKSKRAARSKLGGILYKNKAASEEAITLALKAQAAAPKRELLGAMLARAGACYPEDLKRALALQQGMGLVDLDRLQIETEAWKKMPADAWRQRRAIPLAMRKGWMAVAVESPTEFDGKDYLGFVTGCSIELMWASAQAISRRLDNISKVTHKGANDEFKRIASEASRPMEERKAAEAVAGRAPLAGAKAEDATVTDLVNHMLIEARRRGASDIHVEAHPRDPISSVRLRVDGDLMAYDQFDRSAHDAVVSRLKIMADLDISERRRPQDGKFSAKVSAREVIEARLSVIPAAGGWELATIRLLSRAEPMELAALGILPDIARKLSELSEAPHGLVLVCGPTGSGKTTTLHSVLARINTPERKIWTVEDPVEIIQPGLCQTQAQPKIGFGFDAALKAFLRADPDVIMVGEIRDEQTAKAALEASLTGHLVMSTLHTNSAAETAVRLLDLGADPFALGDALRGILAQRLTKKLCSCAKSESASLATLDQMAQEHQRSMGNPRASRAERDKKVEEWRAAYGVDGDLRLREPVGCPECKMSGHKGRLGIYELLVRDAQIGEMIARRERAEQIAAKAIEGGMVPLRAAALEAALRGDISLKEARGVSL